jgi:16S rRNA (guanine527-N7)-methyltransferase
MTQITPEELLKNGLNSLGIAPEEDLVSAMMQFVMLLEKWNRAFNLTGTRDPADIVTRHVLDSISVRPYLTGISVLDVGTGAGLPGLPLALVESRRLFTLLDSGGKKARFVRHAVAELALNNVAVEQIRVENYSPADPFDSVVCRAFTSLGNFVRHCGQLAVSGGRLLAMKSRIADTELSDLPSGWAVTALERLEVPGLDARRQVVILERQ